ncbi:acyltransferase family protein [Acaricomes phytoseiuli]|uniref:acyltransferase family protein n=1 Tax=Acaricomes phytoseiuli TaxID=291968 RepID=UPI0004766CA5|nr:acyltransferase family protein [Acaricomes phytoseiuli]
MSRRYETAQGVSRHYEQRPETSHSGRRFRPEVEGLRFVAVFLVVVYHIWFNRVSGGVDIFLLISAFLMTLQFDWRISSGEPIRLGRHWLKLAKRLLPLAALVIAVVTLLSWWIVPGTRWASVMSEGWASLFYFENWALAANATDYYASNSEASPFQHFWSLSLQGQVLILWPLIFLSVALVCRRTGWNPRAVMAAVFGTIFVASLAFSVWQTQNNQALAYFDLRTRLWEFALGSLVALIIPLLSVPRRARVLLGWAGLILIVTCGMVLQVEQQFPGYLALWPTLAAAMVIVAGDTSSKFGVDRFLSARPVVFMGGNAYGLYLWHWPILVLYLIWRDQEAVSWYKGLAMIVLSLVLAVVTTRFVERPLRQIPWVEARWYRSVPVVLGCVLLAAAPLAAWQGYARAQIERVAQASSEDNPGAIALVPGFTFQGDPNAPIKPVPTNLDNQWASLPDDCTGRWLPEDPEVAQGCNSFQPSEAVSKTVMVIGNSHAGQWLPAVRYAAENRGWELISVIKGGCPYSYSTPGLQKDCNLYNQEVTEYIEQARPDAVFIVGTVAAPSSPQETIQAGFGKTVNDLIQQGIDVFAIRDNPRFSFNMAECAMTAGPEAPRCNPARNGVLAETSPFELLSRVPEGLYLLDMTDSLCTPEVCPAVVGNIFVYMDDNHLTKDYSATIGPQLYERILDVVGEKIEGP